MTEWEDVVKYVLHPCFKGSKQLESFTLKGGMDGHGVALSAASAEDSWLQWPKLVKDSTHWKKEEDIYSGCVLPACKRRLAENFAEVRALPGSAGRPPDRRVVLSRDPGGYAYLEFDIFGNLEKIEGPCGGWTSPGLQAESKFRIYVGLHVLMAYMKNGHTDVSQFPFDVSPRSPRPAWKERYIVAHLGACFTKSCAAPWHVAVADDAFSASQRVWRKRRRGVEPREHKYGRNTPQQLDGSMKMGVQL